MLLCVFLHELGPLAVDESAEGQAVPPGRCEVGDVHSSVPVGLLLTPGQQAAGPHLRLCVRGAAYQSYCQRDPSLFQRKDPFHARRGIVYP